MAAPWRGALHGAPSQGSVKAMPAFLQSGNTYNAVILKIMVRISRLIYQLKTAT